MTRIRARDVTAALLLAAGFWSLARCSREPAPRPHGVTPGFYTPPPRPKAPTPRPGQPTRTPTFG